MEQRLKSFGFPDQSVVFPDAGLVQGSDGAFYGMAQCGGASDNGVAFKLSSDGAVYTVLHSFMGGNGDGAHPFFPLLQGRDGALYGTTELGGTNGGGTVFKLNSDGTGYTVLHVFAGTNTCPEAVMQGGDGALYGITYSAGISNLGTIFKLNTNGTGFTVLHDFTGGSKDGASPYGWPLVQGRDGVFYGVTYAGGSSNQGTVFTMGSDGTGFKLLRSFTGTGSDGEAPNAVAQGSDGSLYGTTFSGGTAGLGTVFKIGTDGTGYRVLHSFTGKGGDGANPLAGTVQGSDGALYGTTLAGGGSSDGGTVFKVSTNGTGYAVLHRFAGVPSDGSWPYAGVVQGRDGALYGMTDSGGPNDNGTVFKLGTDGTGFGILYTFSQSGGDGTNPKAQLAQGRDGVLFGTTDHGGTKDQGTIFRVNTNGTDYGVLYSLGGASGDGSSPSALIQGSDSALYGTTYYGGTNNNGTVFKLNTNGTGYAVLHRFRGGADGASPFATVVQGKDGTLYGTTDSGGTSGNGVVFRLNPDGTGFSVLHHFTGTDGDGSSPNAVMQGGDGALYGTTYAGGDGDNGTVFKLSTNGAAYAVLHRFNGTGGDGVSPSGAPLQGADGVLYGTTHDGGANNGGTVYLLNTDGTGYRVLHRFSATEGDGANPGATLIQASNGALYGTMEGGGGGTNGTIFRLGTQGTGYSVVYSFASTGADGTSPNGLLQGTDGGIYGTAYSGGDLDFGCVFRLSEASGTVSSPAFGAISRSPDGNVRSILEGPINTVWRIEAATSLATPVWSPVSVVTNAGGTAPWSDLTATNYPGRFYRAVGP